MLENSSDAVAVDAFLSLARFADAQYQNIVDYMNSNTYDSKRELVRKAASDVEQLKEMGDKRYMWENRGSNRTEK